MQNSSSHVFFQPGSENIREFLTMMAVCHTVVPERDRRPDTPVGIRSVRSKYNDGLIGS